MDQNSHFLADGNFHLSITSPINLLFCQQKILNLVAFLHVVTVSNLEQLFIADLLPVFYNLPCRQICDAIL